MIETTSHGALVGCVTHNDHGEQDLDAMTLLSETIQVVNEVTF
jgi:hypothetical protein